jgi:hypothetical protein
MKGPIHICFAGTFKPGDPPPLGYCDWHAWAEVQMKAGLKQETCGYCGLWQFPQELSGKTIQYGAFTPTGKRVLVTKPLCLECQSRGVA